MDRETTHRLLRESIVFLCKTHLGTDAQGGFEVDAIICVSQYCGAGKVSGGYDDPQPTVFKFHELVTADNAEAGENVNDWLLSGSSQSFIDELVRRSDQSELSAAKKRQMGEHCVNNAVPTLSHSDQFGTVSTPNVDCVPDLSLVKPEPGLSEDDELRITDVKSSVSVDTADDQVPLTKRLRSSYSVGYNAGNGKTYQDTPGTSVVGDSRTAVVITELEKLASKPTRSSPPPLKVIPTVSECILPSNNDFITRPASHNSVSELHSDTFTRLIGNNENLDESTNGMEQSTPRSCEVCGLLFADFPTFNVHCVTVHGRYACPFCALLFPCESTRERHLFEHTGEPVDDDAVESIPGMEDGSCGTTRSSRHPLRSDISKRQTDYWSGEVSGSMEASDTDDSSLTAVNGTLYDPQVVTRRGVLSCQTLRAIAQLDPSRPFVCDVCRARFTNSSELCDHCAAVHHRIPCPYCGRSFSQKASMERHQRQHTGERPYQCTMCDSSYTRKENLQTHMSRMHGPSGAHQHSDFICVE